MYPRCSKTNREAQDANIRSPIQESTFDTPGSSINDPFHNDESERNELLDILNYSPSTQESFNTVPYTDVPAPIQESNLSSADEIEPEIFEVGSFSRLNSLNITESVVTTGNKIILIPQARNQQGTVTYMVENFF